MQEVIDQEHAKHAMIDAAEKAGAVLRGWFTKANANEAARDKVLGTKIKTHNYEHIGYQDAFTHADLESENTILPILKQAADIPIMSEETNPNNAELPEGSRRWLVDPLDGTSRFRKGLPDFSITIALQTKRHGSWETDIGLVAIPMEERIYIADDTRAQMLHAGKHETLDRPQDAQAPTSRKQALNAQRIELVAISKTNPAITGFRRNFACSLAAMGAKEQETFSTAMMLARMATQPSVDAVVVVADGLEFPWDTDAGAHIAQRGGATVKRLMLDREPCLIVARTPAIATALEQTLREDYRRYSTPQEATAASI